VFDGIGASVHRVCKKVRQQAQSELQKKQDLWQPVAQALAEWLPGARKMQSELDAVGSLKSAEDWLRTTALKIHNERFEPIKFNREISTLVAVPPWRGMNSVRQPQLAGTIVGIEAPPGSNNLEIKPYAVSSVTTDALSRPRAASTADGDVGLDVKYGVTQNLIADFTYNTDFAQVEADEQQVNLTRFSLFFPEKRDFFLENQGTFSFGGVGASFARTVR